MLSEIKPILNKNKNTPEQAFNNSRGPKKIVRKASDKVSKYSIGISVKPKEIATKGKLFVCIYSYKIILQYAYIFIFIDENRKHLRKGLYYGADEWKVQWGGY